MPKELKDAPQSALVAIRGIKSSDDLIEYLSALLADVSIGEIPADDALVSLTVCDKILDVARFALEHTSSLRALASQARLTGGD